MHYAIGQIYIIPNLERDDFKNKKSWWEFQNQGSQTAPQVFNGYLLAQLVDPLIAPGSPDPGPVQGAYPANMENVGFMTANQKPIYDKHDTITAVIRIKTLNTLPVGSRGWGFWKSEWVPVTINQAVWFMEQTANPDSSWAAEETWWRARTHSTVDTNFDFYTNLDGSAGSPYTYDNQQWHTYKIVRNQLYSFEHYVDGQLVQRIVDSDFVNYPPGNSPLSEDYSFNCWNDNFVYHNDTTASGEDTLKATGNKWSGSSRWVLDYVEIRLNNYDPSYSIMPQDAADMTRLRQYPDEIDDGIADGLWKNYSFSNQDEKCIIIATAKAEEYDGYDNDDDLKWVVDSHDYGFNSAKSWNGDVDQSLPKTLVIDTLLSAGSHTLKFYSEVTPILYDANVLSSAYGTIALDSTVNDSGSADQDNYLWKTFDFTCDAGPVAVYLSGSADEESGWDHIAADTTGNDDELRIMVDNTDYGWGTAYALKGNTLFGDVKTIMIIDTLTTGRHSIKLYANNKPTVYRIIVFARNGDSGLPVQLSTFEVRRAHGKNIIHWTTESEFENAGFNLFRCVCSDSLAPDFSDYVRINKKLIAGKGNTSTRCEYFFSDPLKTKRKFSWYLLQDVRYSGLKTNHGPLRVSMRTPTAPGRFTLSQNYPNPFNPTTLIPFNLTENGKVQLTVYDMQGRLIKKLVNEKLAPGRHSAEWNGLDNRDQRAASGVYFYRLQAQNQSLTRKLILLH